MQCWYLCCSVVLTLSRWTRHSASKVRRNQGQKVRYLSFLGSKLVLEILDLALVMLLTALSRDLVLFDGGICQGDCVLRAPVTAISEDSQLANMSVVQLFDDLLMLLLELFERDGVVVIDNYEVVFGIRLLYFMLALA